ncbi:uncharacterized protein IL334_001999 [Kwoniella shivajii]|uniref:Uncharacterized protein n=1 Tax=Kwoniella shivajii TaxID=564305 RepID=A0ABZ1CUL3_9TREE|nr:hypothetical protein IL334_001999 [Kwoniella shivajii]
MVLFKSASSLLSTSSERVSQLASTLRARHVIMLSGVTFRYKSTVSTKAASKSSTAAAKKAAAAAKKAFSFESALTEVTETEANPTNNGIKSVAPKKGSSESIASKKKSYPKVGSTLTSAVQGPGSGNNPAPGDAEPRSIIAIDKYVAKIMQHNLKQEKTEVDKSNTGGWNGDKIFPGKTCDIAQQWIRENEDFIDGLPPNGLSICKLMLELVRRDTWGIIIREKLNTSRVKPSPYNKQIEEVKEVFEPFKIILDRDGDRWSFQIEHVAGTKASFVCSLRVNNSIKGVVMLHFSLKTSARFINYIPVEGHREGSKLMPYIRKIMPKVDPVDPGQKYSVQEIFSALINCVRALRPKLQMKSGKVKTKNAKSGSGATSPSKSFIKGKKGDTVTLKALAKEDPVNVPRKEDMEQEKLAHAGESFLGEFLMAKMLTELESIRSDKLETSSQK